MTGLIRYDLICGDLDSLPEQVNRLLEGGWELLGGPTYAGENEQRVVFFAQAMIKASTADDGARA